MECKGRGESYVVALDAAEEPVLHGESDRESRTVRQSSRAPTGQIHSSWLGSSLGGGAFYASPRVPDSLLGNVAS